MQQRLGFLLAVVMVSTALVPLASAETVTQTWTQTSQIDFSQGSGTGDVTTQPGSVLPGGGISTDVNGKWTVESDSGCSNYCFDRYQSGSPYVAPGKGSIYIGRGVYSGYGNCWNYCYREDRIATPTPGTQTISVFLYPSSCYQYAWYDNSYVEQYFRLTDGNGNMVQTLLRGCATNGWSSYREYYGPYSAYENHNGWSWYKYDIQVPGYFDSATVKSSLQLQTYTTTCWSCNSYIYMWNYIAFDAPSTSEFVSNVHDTGGAATFGQVNVDGYVPAGASLKLQTRTSGNGVDFTGWDTVLSGEPVPSPAGRFIQYRALFTRASNGADPRLDEVRINYAFTQDTTPPRTRAVIDGTAGCAGWLVTTPTVSFDAQDDLSGIAATYWSLDGGFFLKYGSPFPVGDGPHTLDFYSVDGAGNVEAAKSTSLKVDTAPPSTALNIGSPSYAGYYVSPDTVFSLDAMDATSGLRATTRDGAAYGGAFSLGSPDGARTISYNSEDKACNVEATQTTSVFVDGTAPTVQVTSPVPTSFSINGQSSEDVAPFVMARGTLSNAGVYGTDADTLVDILTLGATEACGSTQASDCAQLALIGLAPRVGGVLVVGQVTIQADAADPVVNGGSSGLAGVGFYLDGVLQTVDTAAPFAWTFDATNAALGRHTIEVVAVDNVGNSASDAVEITTAPGSAAGVLATGGIVLDAAQTPTAARLLYDFAVGKLQGVQLPGPPPPPPLPADPAEVMQAIQDALGQVPVAPPVEPPPIEPPPVSPPPAPPLPQLCVGDTCTPQL